MDRHLIEHGASDPLAYLHGAIGWLQENGGGTVVADTKRNLCRSLGCTDGEFARYQKRMDGAGIKFAWPRKTMPYSGNVVAAFASRKLIEELDRRDGIDVLIVIGWSESDYAEWRDKYDPVIMDIKHA